MFTQVIEDTESEEKVEKSAYIITFQNGRTIREKITRVCDSF